MADFFNACGDSGFGREAAEFYGLVPIFLLAIPGFQSSLVRIGRA
jgi:hypothetical protein